MVGWLFFLTDLLILIIFLGQKIYIYMYMYVCVYIYIYNCCCSVTKSRPALCNPMYCSTSGSSVLHYLLDFAQVHVHWDVLGPGGSDSKESACNVRDPVSISGSGRCPGERHGKPLQYSCLENSVEWGVWRATVHGVAESDVTEKLPLLLFTLN